MTSKMIHKVHGRIPDTWGLGGGREVEEGAEEGRRGCASNHTRKFPSWHGRSCLVSKEIANCTQRLRGTAANVRRTIKADRQTLQVTFFFSYLFFFFFVYQTRSATPLPPSHSKQKQRERTRKEKINQKRLVHCRD